MEWRAGGGDPEERRVGPAVFLSTFRWFLLFHAQETQPWQLAASWPLCTIAIIAIQLCVEQNQFSVRRPGRHAGPPGAPQVSGDSVVYRTFLVQLR